MKRILSFIMILILNTSAFAFSDNPAVYNSNDVVALQKIYNQNINILNHWDLTEPVNIDEIEWKCENNTYNLISLDLSNTGVSGKIDLSIFEHIEYYNLANTNIKEIVLPDSMNTIPQHAFEGCSNLEYINIPQYINTIENSAFKNCSELKSVILSNSNTIISSETFSGCVSLECIVGADNIESIGRNAFANCSNLIFYGDNTNDSYIKEYTQSMNYQFSSDQASTVTGCISIMTNKKSPTSYGYPYKFGVAYLYDEYNNLLAQMNLNNQGEFLFSNLSIGYKYRLVIDGEFAVARSKYFIALKNENSISENGNPLPVVTCDFNKDGLISSIDAQIVYDMILEKDEDIISKYNLNGDGVVTAADALVIYSLFGFSYND